jgi:hypothetical protein
MPKKREKPVEAIWPPCKFCSSSNTTGHGQGPDGNVLPGKAVFVKCGDCAKGKKGWQICGGLKNKKGVYRRCAHTNIDEKTQRGKFCEHGGGKKPKEEQKPRGAPITTGRSSKYHGILKGKLQEAHTAVLTDPNITSLAEQIDLAKAEHYLLTIEREEFQRGSKDYLALTARLRKLDYAIKDLSSEENRRLAFQAAHLDQRESIALVRSLVSDMDLAMANARRKFLASSATIALEMKVPKNQIDAFSVQLWDLMEEEVREQLSESIKRYAAAVRAQAGNSELVRYTP